jgi:hypothetical protein
MLPKKPIRYLPTIGILIFIGLYFYASKLYPGGSQIDVTSLGFDWQNNYWCNLMGETALNGEKNNARPVAIGAITMLCASMAFFFFQFANHFEKNKTWNTIIKISGALGMFSAVFIFTVLHDVMTTILSVCGTLVIVGMVRALYRKKLYLFVVMGILCMVIVAVNNLFYYNQNFNQYSPLVQKGAFILILSWTVGLNLKINTKQKP